MRLREAVQVRLQERYRRLYKVNWQTYHNEAAYLIEYIGKTPALAFLVEQLERTLPDLDPEAWVQAHFGWQEAEWPTSEEGRAKVAWHLLQRWAAEPNSAAMFGHNLDRQGDLADGARIATEQVVEPLVEYLQEQLGQASDVLYLLERYVRRLEMFEKQRLWNAFQADTAHGEAIYDADLRRFLFDEGIDYPFSQPRSASGEADLVADVDTDDPLVCEVKLFDAGSYGRSYVGKGFRQAVQYAHDYNKTSAHLVVFNVSDKRLEFPSDGLAGEWPARVETEGVTVYLVRVRAKPVPSASAQPKVETVKITREDLVQDG
jgi:hypothetical protein